MPIVHVVVAVFENKDDQVLIAKRAKTQHQGGKWEFPGGKVEKGENSKQALQREIQEELGVQIQSATLLVDILHEYEDRTVCIDVYSINDWIGEVKGSTGNEGQLIRWVEKQALTEYDFPAANSEILDCIVST